jgi:hypothetical protein
LLGDESFKTSYVGVADAYMSDEKTQPQLCRESVRNQPNIGRPSQACGIWLRISRSASSQSSSADPPRYPRAP